MLTGRFQSYIERVSMQTLSKYSYLKAVKHGTRPPNKKLKNFRAHNKYRWTQKMRAGNLLTPRNSSLLVLRLHANSFRHLLLPAKTAHTASRSQATPATLAQTSTTTGPSTSNFGSIPNPGSSLAAIKPSTRCGAPSAVLTVT